MKDYLLACCCLLACSLSSVYAQDSLPRRVDELSRQITTKISAKQKTTIAVVEFADLEGRVTNLGRFLAEELITRFHETEKFKVIERQLLNKIITEQKLTLTGIVDPASAKKLGQILGVDAIVSGSVSELATVLRVNARLISTETGEIFAVASTEIAKDESVLRLLGGGNTISGGASSPPNSMYPITKDSMGFTIVLKQCKLVTTAVSCEFDVMSNERDRVLSLYVYPSSDPSRLFDEAGTEYLVAQVRIGNRVGEHVQATMVSDVPGKVALRFEGLPSKATKISLLRVRGSILIGTDIRDLTVEFRDVLLVK